QLGRSSCAAGGTCGLRSVSHRSQVTVDPVTFVVLWRAKQWASRTGGVFDPCLGRLSEMWDFRREVPPEAGVYGALANAKLYRTLELDPGNRGVRLTDARAKVDLGAIAKGFAVDRATAVLRTRGIRDALVNAGGDLYAMGRSADGDCWKVGVRDPANPDQTSLEIEAENVGIATSGDYQRYFEHQGVRYHHILDSSTGTPSRGGVHSITVKASNCCTADALATARFGRWVNPVQSTELLAEL
ncbi:MAG: FAD:protein FMN transferase, partial [Gemmatimonadales bacterium]